jgi:hypothetical protein
MDIRQRTRPGIVVLPWMAWNGNYVFLGTLRYMAEELGLANICTPDLFENLQQYF